MRPSPTRLRLDIYNQSKVHLWQAAAVDLATGSEDTDPFIQASLHVILAWLRMEATDPLDLLELFGRRGGPLGAQLRLIGSLLLQPEEAHSSPAYRRCGRSRKPPTTLAGSSSARLVTRTCLTAGHD